jgi:hypothetical protein
VKILCYVSVSLALLVAAGPTWAAPTMIRAGYTGCSVCHVSPQGGGLLTDYGKGVDKAQSLRSGEYHPRRQDSRLRHDVRVLLVQNMATSSNSRSLDPLWGQVTYRHASRLTENVRLSFSAGFEGAPVSAGGSPSRHQVFVRRALGEYRPRQGLEIAVGRDALPDGLGVADRDPFFRRGLPGAAIAYPTQAKLFLWSDRFELASYLFGPDGHGSTGTGEHGAGVVAGLAVWKRAITGISMRIRRHDSGSDETLGFYARVGFRRWGVLALQEFGNEQLKFTGAGHRYAGYSQVFVVPYECLVTSMTVEQYQSRDHHETRLRPEVQLRATSNLTIVFSIRNDVNQTTGSRPSRTYAIQVAVKGMQ